MKISTSDVDFNIFVNIMNNQMLMGYLAKCLLHVDAYLKFVKMLKMLILIALIYFPCVDLYSSLDLYFDSNSGLDLHFDSNINLDLHFDL